MIQFAVFRAFLLYFFRVFNYIAIFLPAEQEDDPEAGSVFDEKKKGPYPQFFLKNFFDFH